MGKNRKPSKKLKNKVNSAQMKKTEAKSSKINPFEVHINKEKFSVLGRKLKHDKGMPGVSRAKATRKRAETLGKEYAETHKVNRFKDNRVGKFGMSKEDAASARFVAERLNQFKSKRQSLFNLNDDEVLTHKGHTIEELEQYHDTISDDEDDDEMGRLDAEFTGAAHFGGGDEHTDDADGRKRKNAIEDLIAEQKRRKAEVSKEKEEVNELTQKLDERWVNLLPLMDLTKNQDESRPKPDDFDRALKEMVFEPRGSVTDKLNSEEKLLQKEKAKLERLEHERLERMQGLTEEERKAKHRSADDLDDGYFLQPFTDYDKSNKTLAYSLDGQPNRKDDDSDEELERLIEENAKVNGHSESDDGSDSGDEESGDDEGEEEEEESGESDKDESDGDDFSHLLYDSDSEKNSANSSPKKKKRPPTPTENKAKLSNGTAKKQYTEEDRKAIIEKAAKELPYTFELPHKYQELEKLLKNCNAEYQSIILDRMIKCNHPKVEPTNKPKMVGLFAFLLQHINDTAQDVTADNIENFFKTIYAISPHLYDLSHMNPAETMNCFREVIKEKQSEFKQNVKEYPTLGTLVFFKLASDLYSTSDFRHMAVTPSIVFISQILSRCRVTNRSEIASGLFLVTVLLEYTQLSKRFLPAALNFLSGVVYLCVRKRPIQQLKVIPPFRSVGDHNSLLVLSSNITASKIKETDSMLVSKDLVIENIDDSFRVRALNTTLQLATDSFNLLVDNCSVKCLIEPISNYLDQINLENYPPFILKNVEKFKNLVETINNKKLTFIVPAAKKPKALRLLEPKFERVYDDKRDHRPGSKDKVVREGLKRKIKRETKGAIREIRRDNAFLSKVKLNKQLASDAERRAKVKQIFAEASVQQSELNAMDRKKKHL